MTDIEDVIESTVFGRRSSTPTARHIQRLEDGVFHVDYDDPWNEKTPKREDDISDWLQRQLNTRLKGGSIVDREVGVQRIKDSGGGTRVDLTQTILNLRDQATPIRVIIEAKLVNNKELLTAMKEQLIGRYLRPTGQRHGILLVYWLSPDQRPEGWSRTLHPSKEALAAELQKQANALAPEYDIRPSVLDISKPAV